MAEGRHVSDAEIEEMKRRKHLAPNINETTPSEPLPGEHEQEADRTATVKRTRILDTVITANPD